MTEQLIANCLHLTRREDRERSILQQAKEQGFYLKFWEGTENRHNRKMGVCQGHKRIISDAKENGYPYVCVMEDDAVWLGNGSWDYFLENMPDDFDIYFSMIYCGEIHGNRIISQFSGMTCYIVAERFYDFFLSITDDCHIDRELGKSANSFKFILCPEIPCEQFGGMSDNTLTKVNNYRPQLKRLGRKMYGGIELD